MGGVDRHDANRVQVIATSDSERVIAYVDGYNLYYGLKAKGWRRLLWLDLWSLFSREMNEAQTLVAVKYFTSTGRKQSQTASQRQATYLEALESAGVDVHNDGRFRSRKWKCPSCDEWGKRSQEKRTDVAIAVEIVHDANHDNADTFWLMCADEDLIPAVAYVRNCFPQKTVVIVPPRGRRSLDLIAAATAKRDISRSRLSQAQLRDTLTSLEGKELIRPPEWA